MLSIKAFSIRFGILAALSVGAIGAQTGASAQGDRETRVDSVMANFVTASTPGAGVLVVQDGRVALKKGYGLAIVEPQVPIQANTRFLLASVSKQFTAMAIMILSERGRLSYDDHLTKFFPEFPRYADLITVRHLLNHVAGFPEYERLFMEAGKVDRNWPRSAKTAPSGYEPTALDALKFLAQTASLRFDPGSRYEYSNSGYMLLGQIIEKASGQRYARFLSENIFQPLDMTETAVYDETKPSIANRASSYAFRDDSYEEIDYTPFNFIYGEDNVVTTLNDLYKWDQALYNVKLVRGTTLRLAFTPGTLNDGSRTTYGFGWQTRPILDAPALWHNGSWMGFRTIILRFPEKRTSVVVLANRGNLSVNNIAQSIAAIYLEDTR